MDQQGSVRSRSADPHLVSVVIPTRNRAELVIGALESVWSQSYRPLELIVVDDGSTDRTCEIVTEWLSEHAADSGMRARLVCETARGANAARNRGIAEASGDLVAFLDSDDRWLPGKISQQLERLENETRVGGVYCGVRHRNLVSGEIEADFPRRYPEGDLFRKLLICDVTAPTSCWLVRTVCFDAVGGFDESLPARQDWDMWIRLAEHYKIAVVPSVLVEEGVHFGERIRSNPEREIEAYRMIFQKHLAVRSLQPLSVRLAARSAMYRRRGRVYSHHGAPWHRAAFLQLAAIVVWPFDIDSYAALVGSLIPRVAGRRIHESWNRVFGATPFAIRSH